MQIKRVFRTAVVVLVVTGGVGSVALAALLWHIHASVRHYSAVAQAAHPHPGDDVASLVDFVTSEEHSLRERNLAVWTLGRLRDPAALPVLESFYTGGPCDHDTRLCQGELRKAIVLCGGTAHVSDKTGPEIREPELCDGLREGRR
jgi:hypothetical protein